MKRKMLAIIGLSCLCLAGCGQKEVVEETPDAVVETVEEGTDESTTTETEEDM